MLCIFIVYLQWLLQNSNFSSSHLNNQRISAYELSLEGCLKDRTLEETTQKRICLGPINLTGNENHRHNSTLLIDSHHCKVRGLPLLKGCACERERESVLPHTLKLGGKEVMFRCPWPCHFPRAARSRRFTRKLIMAVCQGRGGKHQDSVRRLH